MKYYYLILFCAATLYAVNKEVIVNVTDQDGLALEDALVWIGPADTVFDQTDHNGIVSLEVVNNQKYMIVAQHLDYSRTQPLYIDLKSDTNLTIQLPGWQHLRIASFNMAGNRGDGKWEENQIIPLAKIFWTVQPDIILLQECPQDELTFEDFQAQYLPGYHNAVSPNMYYIANGICSFGPIKRSYYLGKDEMTRDLWCSEIEVNGEITLTCMSVHLKAAGDQASCLKRNQEANFIVDYCQELDDNARPYILGGDFNEDINQVRSPSDIFNILEAANMVILDAKDDNRSRVTLPEYYRRYDYLMISEALDNLIDDAVVFRSESMNDLPAWLELEECESASDHRLIYADFEILPEPSCWGMILVLILIKSGERRKSN